MNRKLIASLSIFGLLMGFASVLGLTKGIEWLLWLIIGIFSAVWISRKVSSRRFLHGFLVGIFAGLFSPLIQFLFFSTYLLNNPEFAEKFDQVPAGLAPGTFVLISAPVIAGLYATMLGFLTILVGKLVGRRTGGTVMN